MRGRFHVAVVCASVLLVWGHEASQATAQASSLEDEVEDEVEVEVEVESELEFDSDVGWAEPVAADSALSVSELQIALVTAVARGEPGSVTSDACAAQAAQVSLAFDSVSVQDAGHLSSVAVTAVDAAAATCGFLATARLPTAGAVLAAQFQRTRANLLALTGDVELLSAGNAASGASLWAALARPHILVAMLDDLGWEDVGFHERNFRDSPTPNMDVLVRQSVELTRMYTSPICSPSRGMFATGRFHYRTGFGAAVHSGTSYQLSLDETYFYEVLRDAGGYFNTLVGKWHLSGFDVRSTPLFRGFESYVGAWSLDYTKRELGFSAGKFGGLVGYGKRSSTPGSTLFNATVTADRPSWAFHGDPLPAFTNEAYAAPFHAEDLLGPETIRATRGFWALEALVARPTYTHVGFRTPHTNFDGVPEAPRRYSRKKDPLSRLFSRDKRDVKLGGKWRLELLRMVHNADRQIADIVAEYKRNGMWADTVFVFTTDNGGLATDAGGSNNGRLHGRKNTVLWDGGIRVTTFVHGTASSLAHVARAARGVPNEDLMHFVDFFPTLVHGVAGLPEEAPAAVQRCAACAPYAAKDRDGVDQWASIAAAGGLAPMATSTRVFMGDVKPMALVSALALDAEQLLNEYVHPFFWDLAYIRAQGYGDFLARKQPVAGRSVARIAAYVKDAMRVHGAGYGFVGRYKFVLGPWAERSSRPWTNQARWRDASRSNPSAKRAGPVLLHKVLPHAWLPDDVMGPARLRGYMFDVEADPGGTLNLFRRKRLSDAEYVAAATFFAAYKREQEPDRSVVDLFFRYGLSENPVKQRRVEETGNFLTPFCEVVCDVDSPDSQTHRTIDAVEALAAPDAESVLAARDGV